MIECAWASTRTKDTFFNTFSYRQGIERKKNRMKVQVAVARKMLVAIWYILKDRIPYHEPSDQNSDTTQVAES